MKNEFKIEVFIHLKKFMLRAFPHQRGTFTTYEKTELGKLVTIALLKHRQTQFTGKSPNDQERNRPMATIILRLTEAQRLLKPRQFKLAINLEVDDVFKRYLLLWITTQGTMGVGVQAACRSFLEYYDIDETEYSLGAAYKHWQRENGKSS